MENAGPSLDRLFDLFDELIANGRGSKRSNMGPVLGWVADFEVFEASLKAALERVINVGVDEKTLCGDAGLSIVLRRIHQVREGRA